MTRFFAIIGVIAICLVGIGFYTGYLQVGTQSSHNSAGVTVSVDPE